MLAGLLIAPPAALAAKSPVAVIPVGDKEAFLPTARVASALVSRLNRKGQVSARLYHPLPPSPAERPRDGHARAALRRAHSAFQSLEFDDVRRHTKAALGQYRLEIEAGHSASGYVSTLHLIAATELFDNRLKDAQQAMRDAIVFNPSAPSKKLYNPTVQKLHQEASKAQPARLAVKTVPDALVWINGRLRGHTGTRHRLRPGLHWVRIFRPGYAPWLDWVRLHPGQEQTLSPRLQRDPLTELAAVSELRKAVQAPSPPGAISRATNAARVKHLVVVYAPNGCTGPNCDVAMRWATAGRWYKSAMASYSESETDRVAAVLLGDAQPVLAGVTARSVEEGRPCRLDSDCGHNERCDEGLCERVRPLTHRWWFWTIIAVAAAGVTAGVVIPLTLPKAPVIEVQ